MLNTTHGVFLPLNHIHEAHGSRRNGLLHGLILVDDAVCLDGLWLREYASDVGDCGGSAIVGESGSLGVSLYLTGQGDVDGGGGSNVCREALSSSWIPGNMCLSE